MRLPARDLQRRQARTTTSGVSAYVHAAIMAAREQGEGAGRAQPYRSADLCEGRHPTHPRNFWAGRPLRSMCLPEDAGCCAKSAAKVDLSKRKTFTCSKCGLEWRPEMVDGVRVWRPQEAVLIWVIVSSQVPSP